MHMLDSIFKVAHENGLIAGVPDGAANDTEIWRQIRV